MNSYPIRLALWGALTFDLHHGGGYAPSIALWRVGEVIVCAVEAGQA